MKICALKKEGFAPDVLLLLEHPPVITLGRNGDWHNLVVAEETLKARGVSRYHVDRGGDITFHGPGQVVGYPLLKLERHEQDVHRYMRNLEETMIRTLAEYGIVARREEKLTGVWTDSGKICAMGVHISRWVTRHGFALNVNTDLSFYDLIVPCGLQGKQVTSMRAILGREVDLPAVEDRLTVHFGQVFGRQMVPASEKDLAAMNPNFTNLIP
ncbi:MAG: lipoyl(octanoyl) transferase LipB [Acidobacteriia bacterium]|nr:lipoyl(octanoyl) transferase LipB [Terriglobia bacterium]